MLDRCWCARNTKVTVTFAEIDGGTAVRLLHEFFPDASTRDQNQGGWDDSLDQLTELLQAAS